MFKTEIIPIPQASPYVTLMLISMGILEVTNYGLRCREDNPATTYSTAAGKSEECITVTWELRGGVK